MKNKGIKPELKQAESQIAYIWVALTTALFAGFDIGAHLTFVIGYDYPLGKGYHSFIQTHGHVQLVGWAGLFIMGISLHFIPRLLGVPLSRPSWIKQILWLMGISLLLRTIGQTALPYLTQTFLFAPFSWMAVSSGLLEWIAILMYLFLLIGTLRGAGEANKHATLKSVKPYLGMVLTGWFLYASVNLALLIDMALRNHVIVNQGWNELAIQLFIGLTLLPVAFVFSIRTFPLYLRVPVPDWAVRGAAFAYLFSFLLQWVPSAVLVLGFAPRASFYLSHAGMLLKGGVILWFVWKLDLLVRFRDSGTGTRIFHPPPNEPAARSATLNQGEFGRFERLIYAAYTWLILGAFFDILLSVAAFLEHPITASADVVRHFYLLGFITHLIFGVSVRMLPGFVKRKRVFSPKLVDATFWLGTAALLCRVLPLILPSEVFDVIPISIIIAKNAFAFSGVMGWLAVLCLAINLWKTTI